MIPIAKSNPATAIHFMLALNIKSRAVNGSDYETGNVRNMKEIKAHIKPSTPIVRKEVTTPIYLSKL